MKKSHEISKFPQLQLNKMTEKKYFIDDFLLHDIDW